MTHEHARPGEPDRQDGHGHGRDDSRQTARTDRAEREVAPGSEGAAAAVRTAEPDGAGAAESAADTAAADADVDRSAGVDRPTDVDRSAGDDRPTDVDRSAGDDQPTDAESTAGRGGAGESGTRAEPGTKAEPEPVTGRDTVAQPRTAEAKGAATPASEGTQVATAARSGTATLAETASRPDTATQPRTVTQPGKATQPDTATAQAAPTEQGTAAQSGTPTQPGKSAQSDTATERGAATQSGKATQPDTPAQPDAATKQGAASEQGAAAEEATPTKAAAGGGGLGGLGGGALDGDLDEQALRRMLQGAVQDLEPAPKSLDQLRRAVPARRTRRRQILVGAFAAIVLGGAAIPALVRVTAIGDTSPSRPANAASSERTPDQAAGGHHGERGPSSRPTPPSKKDKDKEKEEKEKEKAAKEGKDKPTTERPTSAPGPVLPPNPSTTLAATSPTCLRDQLGDGGSSVGAADAEGRVYGSFRIVNTSADPCSVDGSGVVGAVAQGSADASGVQVVDHTSGDPATELPPPSAVSEQIILRPGEAYEVRYAWIPTAGGGSCSDASTPSPTPTPAEPPKSPVEGEPGAEAPGESTPGPGSVGGGSGSGGGGVEPSTPSSVVISHTPDAGDPAVATATVPEACAGTVYHTGALASP
ncbi:hypothetical protein ACMA1D_10255 [Streptomyces sp. 796.1]|uniref:hypothetical protein n=1 Tax=Streptomyces sp. 796.1 TaxID=3163029 RepID=UPI0039C8C82A